LATLGVHRPDPDRARGADLELRDPDAKAVTTKKPEPVVAPPPGNPRFPLMDSMRAIAALSVLLTHVGFVSDANTTASYGPYLARLGVGVTVFFLLSGFLLYRPFVSARLGERARPRIPDYARRRVLRIIPAYWLALTLLAIWPGLPQMWESHSWVYYGFVQIYSPTWFAGGLLPAWSLAVEVSFYAALPLIVLLMERPFMGRSRRARIRSELAILALLLAGALAFRVVVRSVDGDAQDSELYFNLLGNFDWFALGMFLALASVLVDGMERTPAAVRLIERRPSLAWLVAAVLFWAVATQMGIGPEFPQVYTPSEWLLEHVVYGAIAFFLLLPAVFGDSLGGAPRAVLRSRVLAWLGLISYGIFLWNNPLASELSSLDWGESGFLGIALSTLALSVLAASASYYLVERPILHFKEPRSRRRGTRAAAVRA
jgi:peptidoglycan/LPS O-acetylase OafA/YrhL